MDEKLILVVDDDEELCGLLTQYLEPEGFRVRAVHDGVAGLAEALSGRYALAILDVMLPGANGFEVLHRVREASPLPVIMLTARGDDVDRIVGLEIGADDYLPKPFLPRELVARMRAVLRRVRADAPAASRPGPLALDGLSLAPDSRSLRVHGAQVHLTDAEFSILYALLAGAGAVVPREELCRVALGREAAPEDRSLAVHVSNLRRKLAEAGATPAIKAVRGEGYILCRPEPPQDGPQARA